jgi:ABC-2 type transport system ATP-binding protein
VRFHGSFLQILYVAAVALCAADVLDVVERVCNRVAIMAEGKLLVEGTPQELQHQHGADTLEQLFTRLTGLSGLAARAETFATSMRS